MSDAKSLLIVGCGKRVRETALPALAALDGRWQVRGIYARSARTETAAGAEHAVRPLAELDRETLRAADLVYLAVGKDAVPEVLARLVALEPRDTELLIDTPVVRFKHFKHVARLAAFRAAWVAEDVVYLPWLDVVRGVCERGAIGRPLRLLLDRSGYAYHAVALAKTVLGSARVRSARRERLSPWVARRELWLANKTSAIVLEPRDYAVGRFTLLATEGSLGDHAWSAPGHRVLEPVVAAGALAGFRCGDVEMRLTPAEARLFAGGDPHASPIARMEDHKRVGFLRLLERLHAGRGAYPVTDALDDMVVDYHLEKLGRYVANPFTSARSPLARALLRAVSR